MSPMLPSFSTSWVSRTSWRRAMTGSFDPLGSLADVRQQREVARALDRRGQLTLVERRRAVALAARDLALGAGVAAERGEIAVVDLEHALLLEPARLRRVGALGARLLLAL